MKKAIFSFIIVFSFSRGISQTAGLYVDKFNIILGNVQKEDSLLNYAVSKGFNYLALYDLWTINSTSSLTNTLSAAPLANFINKAKTVFGISKIGAIGENFSFFNNIIHIYNQQHSSANQKFDVYNLEFEFWITSSVNTGGIYCTAYLRPGGFTCDTSGGFKFYIRELRRMDSLGNAAGITSETYIGWPNSGQAKAIVRNCDRVLVHAYVSNQNTTYTYTKNRLIDLAGGTTVANVMPIFSAEPSFMGPWVQTNPPALAFSNYNASFIADTGPWKSNVFMAGYQWFAYSYMPKNTTMGVAELRDKRELLIENPVANGELNFIYPEEGSLRLLDAIGNEKLKITNEKNIFQKINVSHLSNGVYYLEHENGSRAKVIIMN